MRGARRGRLALPLLALFLFGAARSTVADAPRTFALLVGCTDYPFLARTLDAATYDAKVRLRGPAADVAVLEDVLVDDARRAAAHVTTLAGWDDAAPLRNPTRDNVLRGLVRLSRAVAAGDRVVFHFAGHGSRVPDLSGDEPDGLDEVLLPADVRTFEPDGKRVPGAILDDEVGVRLRAIRDAGATVWAGLRLLPRRDRWRGGGDGPTRARLPADLLGVPDVRARGARDRTSGGVGVLEGDDLRGIAATYAVGAEQRSAEMRLPRGVADAPWRGLLTYALTEDLRRTKGAGDLRRSTRASPRRTTPPASTARRRPRRATGRCRPPGPARRSAPRATCRRSRRPTRGCGSRGWTRAARRSAVPATRSPTPGSRGSRRARRTGCSRPPCPVRGVRPAAGRVGRRGRTARSAWRTARRRTIAALEQIARVENLARLAATQAASRTLGLTVRLEARAPQGPDAARPVADRGTVRPGDDLRIDVRNEGAHARRLGVPPRRRVRRHGAGAGRRRHAAPPPGRVVRADRGVRHRHDARRRAGARDRGARRRGGAARGPPLARVAAARGRDARARAPAAPARSATC